MKSQKTFILITFLLNLISGQDSKPRIPLSFYHDSEIQNKLKLSEHISIPVIEMPPIDSLKIQKIINQENIYGSGIPIVVDINVKTTSKIDTLENGIMYRLVIKSEGAEGLGITFKNYELHPDGELYIYNKDKSDIMGLMPMREESYQRKFRASRIIRGDEVVIEYFEPYNSNNNSISSLLIGRILHIFR